MYNVHRASKRRGRFWWNISKDIQDDLLHILIVRFSNTCNKQVPSPFIFIQFQARLTKDFIFFHEASNSVLQRGNSFRNVFDFLAKEFHGWGEGANRSSVLLNGVFHRLKPRQRLLLELAYFSTAVKITELYHPHLLHATSWPMVVC